ncbi:MAG: metalloprotease TldD [Nitrospirae bacterium]|nr:metalloprotease TldD [Nitrospirota bacterium]
MTKAEEFFLRKFDLDTVQLERTIGWALDRQIDYADLYFEYRTNEAVSLEEGMVKKAVKTIGQGVGVRAIAEEKTGYAYSDEITIKNLEEAARTARCITTDQTIGKSVPVRSGSAGGGARPDLYPMKTPVAEISVQEKIDLLNQIDILARRYDPRITKVMASFSSEHKVILIATSEGLIVGDIQPLSRLNVTCIAEENGNRQVGSYGGGGRVEYSFFLENRRFEEYTREAARQAVLNLSAVDAPAGTMDVVLGSGWPGILLHEAIGHGLEGDFNRKRTSAFTDLIGKPVASEICTVVDDGTIPGRRGSLNIDDEGTSTHRTVLIEKGILRGYLQDKLNAKLMGTAPTGNGRRESFMHIPMPRMTNTFMLAGESDPAEIIRSVKNGLYAVSFGGGQVDITSGKFVFSASEAYRIENGKVTAPVKGATLIGNGPDVLKRVTMVGNDLRLDAGVGTCGKDGQSVPVGVGLPTLKINDITVGGTQG